MFLYSFLFLAIATMILMQIRQSKNTRAVKEALGAGARLWVDDEGPMPQKAINFDRLIEYVERLRKVPEMSDLIRNLCGREIHVENIIADLLRDGKLASAEIWEYEIGHIRLRTKNPSITFKQLYELAEPLIIIGAEGFRPNWTITKDDGSTNIYCRIIIGHEE